MHHSEHDTAKPTSHLTDEFIPVLLTRDELMAVLSALHFLNVGQFANSSLLVQAAMSIQQQVMVFDARPS